MSLTSHLPQPASAVGVAQPTSPRRGEVWRAAAALAILLATPAAAQADLRFCNMTPSRIGIALGLTDGQEWITEGWWNLKPNACETLVQGDLASRYYYVHAVDYDRGGEWGGKVFMCTRDREFTIRGTENCLSRGFDRAGFFEVDTGEQKSWTIQLTDTGQANAAPR
jgi:uncharacterized membrane protein